MTFISNDNHHLPITTQPFYIGRENLDMHCHTKSVRLSSESMGITYDVHIGIEAIADVKNGTFYDGDVHVWLAADRGKHVISVYSDSKWTLWDPKEHLQVTLLDTPAFLTPCKTQGLRYVASDEECRRVSKGVPTDVSTLAALIAADAKLPAMRVQEQGEKEPSRSSTRKRAGTTITTSGPAKSKKACAKAEPNSKSAARTTTNVQEIRQPAKATSKPLTADNTARFPRSKGKAKVVIASSSSSSSVDGTVSDDVEMLSPDSTLDHDNLDVDMEGQREEPEEGESLVVSTSTL